MKKSTILTRAMVTLLLFISVAVNGFSPIPASQQYYEIKLFRIADNSQESRVDAYLKDAYLPALHRAGIQSIGVFKPVESDTTFGKIIYVLIPFNTIEEYMKLPESLAKDKVYSEAGKSFINAAYDNPPYKRFESILLKAFMNMPLLVKPEFDNPVTERIYELRSYESATDAKAVKKIEMFNKGGEIALFGKLKFNAVFYGEVLIGSHMPNLMYMITFSDMKSHDEHWAAFRDAPEWKKLAAMEEYKNTVSKVSAYLLHPTDYSDF